MPTLRTPETEIYYETFGDGSPVTLFGHGLGSSIPETRPLASGVNGTRAFLDFRGHGASPLPAGEWRYGALGRDLLAVADEVGATRCLGASMGSGAMLGLLAEVPDRFEKCVFFLPASLDQPRESAVIARFRRMADLLDAKDEDGLTEQMLSELPEELRDNEMIIEYTRQRAREQMVGGIALVARALPVRPAMDDRSVLAKVTSPCLVIGQEFDDIHPAAIARDLAAALPDCELHIFERAGSMWLERDTMRKLIAGFLND